MTSSSRMGRPGSRRAPGVNTGEVVSGDPTEGEHLVVGDAVNVAARLEQAAGAMEILIGPPTYRLVREAVDVEPVEPLELKGKAEPVPAYRLLGLAQSDGSARGTAAPLVGRERELRLLLREHMLAAAEGRCRLATVLGEAGVESRACSPHSTTRSPGACLPAVASHTGAGSRSGLCVRPFGRPPPSPTTRRPRALWRSSGSSPGPRPPMRARSSGWRLRSGSPAASSPSTRSSGARKLVEAIAARGPLVLAFEDVHWAETTFLEFVDHLAQEAEGPVLLVCLARPDFLEFRQEWGEQAHAVRISLEPLGEAEVGRVIEELLGKARVDEDVRARIATASEGNPLFVEQLLEMMVEEGLLRRNGDAWVAAGDLSTVSMPPTIHALLASRLESLNAEEREVIEAASVIGQQFVQDALEELVSERVRERRPRASSKR